MLVVCILSDRICLIQRRDRLSNKNQIQPVTRQMSKFRHLRRADEIGFLRFDQSRRESIIFDLTKCALLFNAFDAINFILFHFLKF